MDTLVVAESERDTQETRALNRRIAKEAIVLLKNDQGLLPMRYPTDERIKVAIVGMAANSTAIAAGGGSSTVRPSYQTTPLEGLQAAIQQHWPASSIQFSQGYFSHRFLPLMNLVKDASSPRGGFKLDFYNSEKVNLDVSQDQPIFSMDVSSSEVFLFDDRVLCLAGPQIRARASGSFDILDEAVTTFGLVTTGRARLYVDEVLLVDNWSIEQTRGTSFLGHGTVDVRGSALMKPGRHSVLVEYHSLSTICDGMPPIPGGGFRLGSFVERRDQEVLDEAINLGRSSDLTILCLGTGNEYESEGFDRLDMK
jgi:beta-glucosidase